jgi:hypothetical protein
VSATFVNQLRSKRTIAMAEGAGSLVLRVEAADLWETVRVSARPDTPVGELKTRVVAELFSPDVAPEEFVFKLRGWEMLDERQGLNEAGVGEGATLLLARRRRRPLK